jgi:hypothetical protein
MTDQQTDTDRETRKHAYEHVLNCVRHQTTRKQPPGVTAGQLWTHLVDHGSLDHEEANKARQAAIENDDLVQWRDTDGTTRLTCADDAEALERARDRLTEGIDKWSERDKASLGAINTALMEVEE